MSTRRRRPGFTLVELLTVVAIIALLIGILLPSLTKARNQAKKVKTAGLLAAIEKGLEMFNNDFNGYPDSSAGSDPIDWSVGPEEPNFGDAILNGAHWLARALAGHDQLGVDAKGLMMQKGPPGLGLADPLTQAALRDGSYRDRKGLYLEADDRAFAPDNDTRFKNVATGPNTGRPVVFDAFDYPVIYYRANPRARTPVAATGNAIYVQSDNVAFTGMDLANPMVAGWDFGSVGQPAVTPPKPVHALGQFGGDPLNPDQIHDPPVGLSGKTFVDYLHSHTAHETGGIYKPVNAERFILISPGVDGVYGTQDDVSNFKSAL